MESRIGHLHQVREGARRCSRFGATALSSRRGVWRILAGVGALSWLVFRSGAKSSRLSYPCQQAALTSAGLAFGGTIVGLILALRIRISRLLHSAPTMIVGGSVAMLALAWFTFGAPRLDDGGPQAAAVEGYRPELYHVTNVRGVEPGRFGGVDDLVSTMGTAGLKLYRSAATTRTSGADGLIEADDVVLIKINAQWSQRGGTNTDVLRGIIRRIVEHPDGFMGEVVVADNGQGSGSLTRPENNAENLLQSPQAVADDFANEGWAVSTRLWDTFRTVAVAEYSSGDMTDGYVVSPTWDAETTIKVSYPKFKSAAGTHISYRNGIWDQDTETYDPDRLVVINMPILKTHSIYAVTAAVKNHMGVITQSQGTDSHAGVSRGGLGSVMAEVRAPDLTILDCVWILARPGLGPSAPYVNASRRDELVAGTDPVALDMWAVKHILVPQILANGFTPSQFWATQDPDNVNSTFRRYVDKSMNEMLLGGIETTNDYNLVNVSRWAGDFDRDGHIGLGDYAAYSECMGGPAIEIAPECEPADSTADLHLDLSDFLWFQRLFGT